MSYMREEYNKMKQLSVLEIIDAALHKDLHAVEDILYTWRNRRWILSIEHRNRVDFVCKYALLCLERAYPGRVWPELAVGEPELIDRASSGLSG